MLYVFICRLFKYTSNFAIGFNDYWGKYITENYFTYL